HALPLPGAPGQVLVSHTDITAWKEAEAALKAQNARLTAILESTDDLIAFRDRENRLLFFNTAFARNLHRLFGVEAQPGLYTPVLLPSAERVYWEKVLERVIGGEPFRRVFDWHTLDGELRHYEISFHPIRMDEDIMGTVEFTRDVTGLKRTEDALHRSIKELQLQREMANLFLTAPGDRVYEKILARICQHLDSRYGYLGHIDPEGNLVCRSMKGDVWEAFRVKEKRLVFPRSSWRGLWGESMRHKRTVCRNEGLTPPEGHVPLKNALVVPLLVENELVGQIAVANKPTAYSTEDQHQLEALAQFIAPVLRIYVDRENAQRDLRALARDLEEKNIALNVLLENREEEKQKTADSIMNNFEKLVFPYYQRLRTQSAKSDRRLLLDTVEANTRKILSSLETPHAAFYRRLTPMEVQVADLIKAGKVSKEVTISAKNWAYTEPRRI
ncbi:MAG: GAF domain-containing protein, partial [Deltaproteobacteria bacterium]|nr:GAF domain-containing protein [Deltaproteobacteria bacterium]